MMLVWCGSVSVSESAQAQLILDRIISRFMFVIPAQQRIHASLSDSQFQEDKVAEYIPISSLD